MSGRRLRGTKRRTLSSESSDDHKTLKEDLTEEIEEEEQESAQAFAEKSNFQLKTETSLPGHYQGEKLERSLSEPTTSRNLSASEEVVKITLGSPSPGLCDAEKSSIDDVSVLSSLSSDRDLSTASNPSDEINVNQNVNEPLEIEALSSSISFHTITPEGGDIDLHDITIHFPSGALNEAQEFQTKVFTEPQSLPQNIFVIAPILQCEPYMTFKVPVTIIMKTWGSTSRDEQLHATILSNKKNTGNWKPVKTVTMQIRNRVQFEVTRFSKFAVTIPDADKAKLKYHVLNGVYVKQDTGRMTSIFYKDDRSLAKTEVLLFKQKYVSALDIPTEHIIRHGTTVTAKIGIDEPQGQGVSVVPLSLPSLTFSDDFTKKDVYEMSFRLNPGEYKGWIIGRYQVKRGDVTDVSLPLEIEWPIQIDEK